MFFFCDVDKFYVNVYFFYKSYVNVYFWFSLIFVSSPECIKFILIDVFQMWLKLYHWCGRGSFSKVVISLWCNYLLLKISHFLRTYMSFLHPRMKCAEFDLFCFCRRRFIVNVYLFCRYYLSLKRGVFLHFNRQSTDNERSKKLNSSDRCLWRNCLLKIDSNQDEPYNK